MDLSFDCVACGLCALRCPAEIVQHKVAILGKRLYGRYLHKDSPELEARVEEVKQHAFDAEYVKLMALSKEDLVNLYYARDTE
jgi:ferredoxin